MVHEGSQVLVDVGALGETVPAVDVARHDGHVLKMAFAPLVADGAVVGVIGHEPLDVAGAKCFRLGVVNGYPRPLDGRGHAGHDDPALPVLFVPEELHGALPAGPHGMHGRVPAEVGQIKAQRQTGLEQVLPVCDCVGPVIDEDGCHRLPPGAFLLADVPLEVLAKIAEAL